MHWPSRSVTLQTNTPRWPCFEIPPRQLGMCVYRTNMILWYFLCSFVQFWRIQHDSTLSQNICPTSWYWWYISHPSACGCPHSNGPNHRIWMDHQITKSYFVMAESRRTSWQTGSLSHYLPGFSTIPRYQTHPFFCFFLTRVSKQLTQTSKSWRAICTSKCPAGALPAGSSGWMFSVVLHDEILTVGEDGEVAWKCTGKAWTFRETAKCSSRFWSAYS